MTKIKTGHHGKHRKASEQKHRKPSAQVHHLSGIQEGERENEDDSKEKTQEPVVSDRDYGDKSDTPEDASEEVHTKRGGVMFTIGTEEEKEDVHDEDYKKNHRKISGTRKKDRHHEEVSLEMRRRPGSELQISENVLHEDDDENLKEGDLEEIAGHRFEKSKGLTKHKISHGHHKPHMVRVGADEAKNIGQDMKMMKSMGYGL